MGREIRDTDPAIFRLITLRTTEARLWLLPGDEVARMIGGIIARYQEICGIIIYAYCILGNHLHLIIRAPNANTDIFCENVAREITKRLNRILGRAGGLWSRRYDDEEILTENDLLNALLYVITNPCHHGLVHHAGLWPGLASYRHVLDEQDRLFPFTHYSRRYKGKPIVTEHPLRITPIPELSRLAPAARRSRLSALINSRITSIRRERRGRGLGFIGRDAIFRQIPGSLPQHSSRSPRPPCYTSDPAALREFLAVRAWRRRLYGIASFRYRLGDLDVQFPKYSFRPPNHRRPRLLPFTPLPPYHPPDGTS